MRYLFVVLIVVFGCKTTATNSSDKPSELQSVFDEVEREVTDDYVLIKVKNVSGTNQTIMYPMKKSIERQIDGNWEPVGVLYCDCGGPPCPAPPNERPVGADGIFSFKWDLMMEECRSDANGRSTVKEKAPSGMYRVTYSYKTDGGTPQQMILTFSI